MVETRWDNHPQLASNEAFQVFWDQHLKANRDVLYVLGAGFDPRMLTGLAKIRQAGGAGRRDVRLLNLHRREAGVHEDMATSNRRQLDELVEGWATLTVYDIQTRDEENKSVGGRAMRQLFSVDLLKGYSDVVVDISAISRTLYFPLLKSLLTIFHKQGLATNLHVVVCENPELDRLIREEGNEADWIDGYVGPFALESDKYIPCVWAPVLGEDQEHHLEPIRELVAPSEICPVVPFPSRDPRRGDRLILEYSDLLFQRWNVEPRNVVYAYERNPFDIYRRLKRLYAHYATALSTLGGVHLAVSALSSKLISLGTLLAAYEDPAHIGVAHVRSSEHRLSDVNRALELAESSTLHSVWLAGEPYE